jgi:hypothetical protein
MTPATLVRHLADVNLSEYARAVDPDVPLDRWISFAVKVLRDAGDRNLRVLSRRTWP